MMEAWEMISKIGRGVSKQFFDSPALAESVGTLCNNQSFKDTRPYKQHRSTIEGNERLKAVGNDFGLVVEQMDQGKYIKKGTLDNLPRSLSSSTSVENHFEIKNIQEPVTCGCNKYSEEIASYLRELYGSKVGSWENNGAIKKVSYAIQQDVAKYECFIKAMQEYDVDGLSYPGGHAVSIPEVKPSGYLVEEEIGK